MVIAREAGFLISTGDLKKADSAPFNEELEDAAGGAQDSVPVCRCWGMQI
ncbi:hypothetical protein SynA1560_01348 [Synechococcus sp. A15-60]|nr:hypothetical protein SynA1560_01348 [Synechococcus sp. A15-60]